MADDLPFDFLAFCLPGTVLQTRDRRTARITAVVPETGLISGEVQMLGACTWRADGRFHQAPAGAAGPWDLMPPETACSAAGQRHESQRHESLAVALRKAEDNPGCCD